MNERNEMGRGWFGVLLALPLLATAGEGKDPFWESVWHDQNPEREIPAEKYRNIAHFKKEFQEKGYDDCVELIRGFAADDRITEGEMKLAIECQGKYKAEEEKAELIRSLKE